MEIVTKVKKKITYATEGGNTCITMEVIISETG